MVVVGGGQELEDHFSAETFRTKHLDLLSAMERDREGGARNGIGARERPCGDLRPKHTFPPTVGLCRQVPGHGTLNSHPQWPDARGSLSVALDGKGPGRHSLQTTSLTSIG